MSVFESKKPINIWISIALCSAVIGFSFLFSVKVRMGFLLAASFCTVAWFMTRFTDRVEVKADEVEIRYTSFFRKCCKSFPLHSLNWYTAEVALPGQSYRVLMFKIDNKVVYRIDSRDFDAETFVAIQQKIAESQSLEHNQPL